MLIESGADIHAANDNTFRKAVKKGHYEIVKLLLKNGISANENSHVLIVAAEKGHIEIVKLLLENGFHNRYVNELLAAVYIDHYELVKLLIEYGQKIA